MRKKYIFQLFQDLALTGLIIALFGYHLFDEPVHEWLGLAFLGVIISHTSLNFWWFKKLFSQKYNGYQAVKTAVNFATFLLFFTACITGILLSKHIFDDFFFHSTEDTIRKSHMLSTHWLQMLIGVHLGLHWNTIGTMLGNWWKLDFGNRSVRIASKILLPIMWTIITIYGIYAFILRDLAPYLLNQVDFAFFDFDESKIVFYFDFFAILIAVAYLSRWVIAFLFFRR